MLTRTKAKRQRAETASKWSTRLPAVLLKASMAFLRGHELAVALTVCKQWRLSDQARQSLFKASYTRESGACLLWDSPGDRTGPNWERLVAQRVQTDRNWREGKFTVRNYSKRVVLAPGGTVLFG